MKCKCCKNLVMSYDYMNYLVELETEKSELLTDNNETLKHENKKLLDSLLSLEKTTDNKIMALKNKVLLTTGINIVLLLLCIVIVYV